MQVTIIVDDAVLYPLLENIAKKRGMSVPALVMGFVTHRIGRICLQCAGLGMNDEGGACPICRGSGNSQAVAPSES